MIWSPEPGWVTVQQAAEVMGCSDKTIRRRITQKKITAKQVDSPWGMTWVIELGQLNSAQQIIETVTVQKQYSLEELSLSLTQYMSDRDAQWLSRVETLTDEIAMLTGQVMALKTVIDGIHREPPILKESFLSKVSKVFGS